MAYESSCRKTTKGACTRINHFTNPKQTYRGEALGVPLGKPGQSDTSDVLSRSGVTVAAYRTAKTSDAMCAVTASVSPKGAGSVRPAQPGPYPPGTSSVFSAEAAEGYVFSGWRLDGEAVEGGPTGLRVPAGDHTVLAEFTKGRTPRPTVTTETVGSGTVKKIPVKRADSAERADSPERADSTERAADSASADLLYQAVPAPGHVFLDWLLDGEPYGGDEEHAKGETAVHFEEEAHTLTAVFGRE
ncbi:hypothetical protein ACF06X_31885 [Streptomyces sp. NPDC015346]|uniref:InlB B-repeat-containing protein n=1 Tax=Streptomyces sp. NPDC015346 TaxID=3364954 RepID=UPI0036FF68FC